MESKSPYRKRKTNLARRTGLKRVKLEVSPLRAGPSLYVARAVKADPRRTEVKALDVALATTNITSAATAQLLNGMVLGTGAFNRIGRKISMLSIRLTGYINTYQAGAAPGKDYFRVALVYDKQTDGVAPTWAQVFTQVDGGGTPTSTAMAHFNLDNKDRFIVLRDLRFKTEDYTGMLVSNPVQTVSAQTECKWIIDEYVKLKGIATMYSATANAGTVADITTGGLFLLVQGMYAAADAQQQIIWTSRMRFTDQ